MTRDPWPRPARRVSTGRDAPTNELTPLAELRLDEQLTPERFDTLAARIDAAVQGELARRAAAAPSAARGATQVAWFGGALPNVLARALRPASLAAAAALVLAVGLAQREDATAAPLADDPVAMLASDTSVQRVLALDEGEAPWIASHSAPSDDELTRLLVAGRTR